jgi:hypothetical protein
MRRYSPVCTKDYDSTIVGGITHLVDDVNSTDMIGCMTEMKIMSDWEMMEYFVTFYRI